MPLLKTAITFHFVKSCVFCAAKRSLAKGYTCDRTSLFLVLLRKEMKKNKLLICNRESKWKLDINVFALAEYARTYIAQITMRRFVSGTPTFAVSTEAQEQSSKAEKELLKIEIGKYASLYPLLRCTTSLIGKASRTMFQNYQELISDVGKVAQAVLYLVNLPRLTSCLRLKLTCARE